MDYELERKILLKQKEFNLIRLKGEIYNELGIQTKIDKSLTDPTLDYIENFNNGKEKYWFIIWSNDNYKLIIQIKNEKHEKEFIYTENVIEYIKDHLPNNYE